MNTTPYRGHGWVMMSFALPVDRVALLDDRSFDRATVDRDDRRRRSTTASAALLRGRVAPMSVVIACQQVNSAAPTTDISAVGRQC